MTSTGGDASTMIAMGGDASTMTAMGGDVVYCLKHEIYSTDEWKHSGSDGGSSLSFRPN